MMRRCTLTAAAVTALAAALLVLIAAGSAGATGGISGRVTGPDGEPLAGVEVQAFVLRLNSWPGGMFLTIPNRNGLVAWTQTATDGSYELAGLPGTLQRWCMQWDAYYHLLFSPPRATGFRPRVLRGLRGPPSRMLIVEDGKTLTGVDIRLGPPASVAGTVTGPDGAPVAGAWVGAEIFTQRDSARTFTWRTTTDGLGRFVLTNLEDEPYYVKVDAPGPPAWEVFHPGSSEPVPIRPTLGATSSGHDVAIPTPGELQVNPLSGQGYTAWSFSTGFEELGWESYRPSPTYLPPGDYRIGLASATVPDRTYYPGTFQWDEASPVTVKSGELTSITLAPAAPGVVNGTVVDGAGTPVEGVAVSLTQDDFCGPAEVTHTGPDGAFTISSRGDRKIYFSKEGYAPVWFNDTLDRSSADVVRFRSGETVSLPPVVLASLGALGSIAGRVTAAGSPSAGTRVEVWASPAGTAALRTITPDADGNFEAAGLPPGAYVLRFLDTTPGSLFGATWYPEAVSSKTATPVLVEPGLQTGSIDADLGANGSIAGTMTQGHQRLPLTPAQACLTDVLGNVLRCVYTSYPGDDTYRFQGVAPGSYLLALDAEQRHSWGRWYPNEASMATATPIVLAPGQAMAGMDIDFPPLGRIEGQLGVNNGTQCGQMALVDGDADVVRWFDLGYQPGPFFFAVPPGRYRLLSTSIDTYFSPIYPQWYPGKTLASEAQVIEVLPGQTVSGIDVMLEDYGHNRPPSLTQPGDIVATEGMDTAFTLAATDPDGDLLTFGAENVPLGATFDPHSGEFRWMPTCTQAGTYPDIWFTVTDHGRNYGSEALSADVMVPVSVAARDCAPVLDPIGNKSVIAGEMLTFQVAATDPEGAGLVLEATDLPTGASFNTADGTFTWTPGATLAGAYTVTFAAVSILDASLRDAETVTITVATRNPPVLDPIGDRSVTAGETLMFTVTASDPMGDLFVLGAAGLPTGASFNAAAGTFTWTPGVQQSGAHSVTFTASAVAFPLLRDSETITIAVTQRNPPTLDPIGARSVIVGELLSVTVTGTDPLGDAIALEATHLPAGATFDATSGTFVWTPGATQAGAYNVTFAAVSTLDASVRDEETLTITALGPLLFRDDFSHGDLPTDPDWVTLSGIWAVRSSVFRSNPQGIAVALTGPGNLAGGNFTAGRITARAMLGTVGPSSPNVSLLFAYRDAQHYRYVRFFPGATEIGQVGTIDDQPPIRQRLSRGLVAGRWQTVQVDIQPGGTVRAYAGGTPLASLKFKSAVPGQVGVMTRNAQGFVDTFKLWARTVLN